MDISTQKLLISGITLRLLFILVKFRFPRDLLKISTIYALKPLYYGLYRQTYRFFVVFVCSLLYRHEVLKGAMNIPEIKSYEEQAIDAVTSIINRAKESLGHRQTLTQLAGTRDSLATPAKVVLTSLAPPLAVTSERLIAETIEKTWQLTTTFMYLLKYKGGSQDACTQNYYFEAIFSQPTSSYPIPQATVSVFFRVAEKYIETPEIKVVPLITFTIEGHHSHNDVRYVTLTADDLLAMLTMKLKLFKRIEDIRLF